MTVEGMGGGGGIREGVVGFLVYSIPSTMIYSKDQDGAFSIIFYSTRVQSVSNMCS